MADRLVHSEYYPLRNKARQYVSFSTGEVISLRQYQKIAERVPKIGNAKTIPTSTSSPINTSTSKNTTTPILPDRVTNKQVQQYRTKTRYQNILDSYTKRIQNSTINGIGPTATKNEIRQSETFKQLYKDYKVGTDRVVGGKRHKALLAFGILDENDDYY